MSVLLLVPTMTFSRADVVLIQPATTCQSCVDFSERLFSFSASLRLILCIELFHSMMDMLECGLRLPLHI